MSERTRLTRLRERGVEDREAMLDFLATQFVAHVAVVTGEDPDSFPVALPVAFALDREGDQLYLHGSVGAGWLRRAPGAPVCVTVTAVDGLVLARSGFHHSMNYRSAVVIGAARLVDSEDELARALDLVVDQIVPGRAATLRRPNRKELAGTAVLAVPLAEASYKLRTGPVGDEPEDVEAGTWAGVLPLRMAAGELQTDALTSAPVPADVAARAADLRG